jgi:hypothetical protein
MDVIYNIDYGQLVIRRDPEGTVVWRSNFEFPVSKIVPLDQAEGCLVMFDYAAKGSPFTFENLLRIAPDGTIQWTAQLPQSHDSFTAVSIRDGRIVAQSWSCFLVEIDRTTGRIVEKTFCK